MFRMKARVVSLFLLLFSVVDRFIWRKKQKTYNPSMKTYANTVKRKCCLHHCWPSSSDHRSSCKSNFCHLEKQVCTAYNRWRFSNAETRVFWHFATFYIAVTECYSRIRHATAGLLHALFLACRWWKLGRLRSEDDQAREQLFTERSACIMCCLPHILFMSDTVIVLFRLGFVLCIWYFRPFFQIGIPFF